MSTAENAIILGRQDWRWEPQSIEGGNIEVDTAERSKSETVILEFVSLRPKFIKVNYMINLIGTVSSVSVLVVFLLLNKIVPALITLPFLLGFSAMFYSTLKDYMKVIGRF